MAVQVVLISGCSSGFGLIAAVKAAKAGHRVFATMRDLNKRAALDRAAAEAGVTLEVRQLDVDSTESIQQCVEGVLRDAGRIDALINNAGFGMGGTVFDLTMDELRAQFETNFFGTVALTKAVLPGMIERRSGRIIQVSSNSARLPTPGVGAYAASKCALEGITEALRLEVAAFGVHVTSVLPGMFKTEAFTKRRLARAFGTNTSPFSTISEKGLKKLDSIVEKNAGDPAVVADLLVKLLDDPAPPLRIVVGIDAKIRQLANTVLPARAWEWLVSRTLGFDQAA